MNNAPRNRVFIYSKRYVELSEGEPEIFYDLEVAGYFAKELVRKPIEVSSSSVVHSEIQYVFRGVWIPKYDTLPTDLLCFVPAKDEIYETISRPVEQKNKKREVFLYVTENIQRDIDTRLLGTTF